MHYVLVSKSVTTGLESAGLVGRARREDRAEAKCNGLRKATYHALDARGELDELLGLDIAHAMDTSNTVTD